MVMSHVRPGEPSLEPLLVSTGIVALAEIGDKTQLLALVLAARFRRPLPIILGILIATLANHALAGVVGSWITTWVAPHALRWVLGLSFLGMAVWTLIPDKLDESDTQVPSFGVFGSPRSSSPRWATRRRSPPSPSPPSTPRWWQWCSAPPPA